VATTAARSIRTWTSTTARSTEAAPYAPSEWDDRPHEYGDRAARAAKLDKRRSRTGVKITAAEMREVALHRHAFHGDWNYEIRPRAT
jgi:hypothetical protein